MICPRCSVAEISEDSNQCVLCGFSPSGTVVTVDHVAPEEVQEIIQKPLAGRFEIEQLIGRGRVSFVYSAREVGSGKEVALKIIPLSGPLDADLVRRFEREASRAVSLRHSHIVPVLASGASGTLLWYSMERVSGRSLAELLRDSGPMDLDSCLRMLDQVASALDYAHRRSVIHGNLKSTNILVDDDGWVRVTDFSIMRSFIRSGPLGHHVPTIRMPEYMAPEQFHSRGETASADQYAMGVVAFEALSGTLPFVGDSYEEIARLHQDEMPARLTELRDDVPILIADAVEQALSKQPTGRFATVLDFVTVLRGGPPRGAEPVAQLEEPRGAPQILTIEAPRRRIPLLYLAGVPAVGLAVLVILLSIGRDGAAGLAAIDESQFARPAPAEQAPVTERPQDQSVIPPPASAEPPAQPIPSSVPRSSPSRPVPVESPPAEEASRPAPVRRPSRPAVGSARLFVNARPWGALFVDGEPVGNTPKANLRVTPGTHVIRVERDGYEPFEIEVEVAAGGEARVTDIVLQPREP